MGALTFVIAAIALCDLLFRRVPNWLVVAGLLVHAAALIMAVEPAVVGFSTRWSASVTGLLVAWLIFVPLWKFGAMGAGDVKFLGLLGFILGLPGLVVAWLLGSVLAGVHTLAVLAGSRHPVLLWLGTWLRHGPTAHDGAAAAGPPPAVTLGHRLARWRALRMGSRQGAPYATYLAIGAGAWLAGLHGWLV